MGTFETLIVLGCIAISAFMSSAEIAIFSLSKFQLKTLKERFRNSHRKIKKLLGDPTGVLITILMVNELSNIALSTIVTEAVSDYSPSDFSRYLPVLERLPEWAIEVVIGTLIAAPIVLLFCEITPKVIAARANTIIAPLTAPILSLLYHATVPFRVFLQVTLRVLLFLVPGKKRPKGPLFETTAVHRLKEEDFLVFAEEAAREGNIQTTELELIRNVFDLDDTPVIEISTPLSRVVTLPSTTTLQTALYAIRDLTRGRKFSRIPVTGKSRTDIVGVLYSKDLLVAKLSGSEELKQTIGEIAWKPFFISQNTRLHSVFRKMRKQRVHMAIVTNDRGIPIGVVTLNDVLEALLSELLSDDELKVEGEAR